MIVSMDLCSLCRLHVCVSVNLFDQFRLHSFPFCLLTSPSCSCPHEIDELVYYFCFHENAFVSLISFPSWFPLQPFVLV